jgi:hypothetical protein
MQEIHSCPNCKALIKYTDRFCGHCGFNLNRCMPQIPSQSMPLEYGRRNPDVRQQYMRANTGIATKGKHSSVGAPVKPISDEISKLLADFFNNRLKAT